MSDTTSFFRYEDLYYAARVMRDYATGKLSNPKEVILDRGYFMAIADKLQAACELQGACDGLTSESD